MFLFPRLFQKRNIFHITHSAYRNILVSRDLSKMCPKCDTGYGIFGPINSIIIRKLHSMTSPGLFETDISHDKLRRLVRKFHERLNYIRKYL